MANGKQPQYFVKWKARSIFWQMEGDLNILENGRQHKDFEDGRQPKYFGKWKTTSSFDARKTTSISY